MRVRAKVFHVAIAAALTCAPLSAADEQPWSEIKVGGLTDKDRDQYDVMLVAINGSMDFPDRALYELSPGQYSFRLASRKRGKSGEMTAQTFAIEIRPCTRYALAADHAKPQPNRSWQAMVSAEEPIKACMKKFADRLDTVIETAAAAP